MKSFLLLLCMLASLAEVYGQTFSITGTVVDSEERAALPAATVLLTRLPDSLTRGTAANGEGRFLFDKLSEGRYRIRVTYLGYQPYDTSVSLAGQSVDLGQVLLRPETRQLSEIQVIERIPPAVQLGDTTQFNAGAFKTNPNANAEDLIQKLPGISMQNGRVQAQGEDVRQVLVDGKPFFGDDPTAALRNLPAEVIDKIQVYDQQSDQSQFTGFDDGQSSKTINIITKVNMRNGQFGRLAAGIGNDGKYQAGGNLNFFNGDRRISIISQSNNINQQNFSTQDLVGVVSSSGQGGGRGGRGGGGPGGGQRGGGGGRGAGGRGGPGGGGGSDVSDFMVGQQSGVSTSHAFGLNYSDTWGKKMTVTGSYFFNMSDNRASQILNRQYILPSDSGQLYTESNFSNSRNMNHRLNFRLDYKIDSANSILIRPRLSMQENRGFTNLLGQTSIGGQAINSLNNQNRSNLMGYNFANDMLYRHQFRKPRRTFSINLNTSYNSTGGEAYLSSENRFFSPMGSQDSLYFLNQFSDLVRNGWSVSSNFMYTEPIGKRSMLQFNYTLAYQQNESDKKTYDYSAIAEGYSLLDSSLTNIFSNTYISQQLGTGYRLQGDKYQLMLRASYQRATLDNEQLFPFTGTIARTFENILPSAMLQYRFSRQKNLRIFYRTQTNAPSITQLQNVLDNSNPIQLRAGNPDLVQDYQHNVFMRYSAVNTEKSSNFFALLGGSTQANYIGNSILIAENDQFVLDSLLLPRGSQLTRPVNLDGYWSLRSFISYGIPVRLLKSNLNFNFSANYSRTPGLINNALNFANARTAGVGLTLSSNISEKLDFTVSTMANYNYVTNTLQAYLNTQYLSQNSQIRLNWIFWKGFALETQFNHQLNSGLSAGFNQNYALWNLGVGKRLFKKQQGEIKLIAFDMLNQNNSIQRNVSESNIEDVQTNVLQRYFMLTFTYNLAVFKAKDAGNNGR